MSRPPRIIPSNYDYHVIVRCNNKEFRFETEQDFSLYLNTLRWVQKKHRFQLFNYELMNSHVHLFMKPSEKFPLNKSMHLINWYFAYRYNLHKERKGHVWLDRYKSIPVESDRYALALMRYINQNPLRAQMVDRPEQWKWSAYRCYAFGEENELITPHESYLALGFSDELRQKEYRLLVETKSNGDQSLRAKFSEGLYIGSQEFGEKFMST